MAQQRTQIIDITKGYIPVLEDGYRPNLIGTIQEDKNEFSFPVILYKGESFIPTVSGITSITYDVTNDFPDLPLGISGNRLQYFFEALNGNIKIALSHTGLYTCTPGDLSWVPILENLTNQCHWTYALIDNILYMHSRLDYTIYRYNFFTGIFSSFTPTFVTAFTGIFKAGSRLGLWDSANTIFWSSNTDLTDFVPSLTSLADYATFEGVYGAIVHILSHKEGFVIYCTHSIVGARFLADSDLLWDAYDILSDTGIVRKENVSIGSTDAQHYVWTQKGMFIISGYNYNEQTNSVEAFKPDIFDVFFDKTLDILPVCINGRYMVFRVYNENPDSDYQFVRNAFIYDLFLQKWGQMRPYSYITLNYIDFFSITSIIQIAAAEGDQRVEFSSLIQIVNGGFCYATSKLQNTSTAVTTSNVTYGKIGFTRLGQTRFNELRIDGFSYQPIIVDVNGIVIPPITTGGLYQGVTSYYYFDVVAPWIDVTISCPAGFKLSGLEAVGMAVSRR